MKHIDSSIRLISTQTTISDIKSKVDVSHHMYFVRDLSSSMCDTTDIIPSKGYDCAIRIDGSNQAEVYFFLRESGWVPASLEKLSVVWTDDTIILKKKTESHKAYDRV